MKVRFSVVEEFLDELRLEQHEVEDEIVRQTCQYEQSQQVPFLFYLSVVAGFVVRGKLIELKQACGDILQCPPETAGNQKARAKAERITQQIENAVEGMNLALRRSVFEA